MKLYRIACYSTAIIFSLVFFQIIINPEKFAGDLGLVPDVAVSVVLRRAALFMAGIVVLTFSIRNLPPSKARQSVCLSMAVTFLGLAIMGSFELIRGTVSTSIILSISIEMVLGLCYFIIYLLNRKFVNL